MWFGGVADGSHWCAEYPQASNMSVLAIEMIGKDEYAKMMSRYRRPVMSVNFDLPASQTQLQRWLTPQPPVLPTSSPSVSEVCASTHLVLRTRKNGPASVSADPACDSLRQRSWRLPLGDRVCSFRRVWRFWKECMSRLGDEMYAARWPE